MKTEYVEGLISRVKQGDVDKYTKYWISIKPKTKQDVVNRWLFAFLSIHTGWKKNKEAYEALKDKNWKTQEDLGKDLVNCKIGLYKTRTKGIWELQKRYDDIGYMDDDEGQAAMDSLAVSLSGGGWPEYRDNIVGFLYGIGMAKVSFALELMFPRECAAVCLDTHLLQMYGMKPNQSVGKRAYLEMEQHWLGLCKEKGYPSPITRHILWDQVQGKKDTRYWSYVFEENDGEEEENPNDI